MKRWFLYAVFIALGAMAGWAYWNWYGCTNGCAITGRWWTSTAYGGVMGYLLLGLLIPGARAGSDARDGSDPR
jgi:hypothetical protein